MTNKNQYIIPTVMNGFVDHSKALSEGLVSKKALELVCSANQETDILNTTNHSSEKGCNGIKFAVQKMAGKSVNDIRSYRI